jgi:hypothetical protein
MSAYCYSFVHSFISGARHVSGTIAEVWRSPSDEASGTEGHRMAVAFADERGQERTVELTGLYRTGADGVGRPVQLLVNPNHPLGIALDSPLNWIGPRFYGTAALGLLLAGTLTVAMVRLLSPPSLGAAKVA